MIKAIKRWWIYRQIVKIDRRRFDAVSEIWVLEQLFRDIIKLEEEHDWDIEIDETNDWIDTKREIIELNRMRDELTDEFQWLSNDDD